RLDGAALVSRGAEGLRERDAPARRGLAEARDDLVVDDLRRGVGDERELGRAAARGGRGDAVASVRVVSAAAPGHRGGGDGDDGGGDERADLHEREPPVAKNRDKPNRVWAD